MAESFYHLFKGHCYHGRIFNEIVLKEWDKVFTGTDRECNAYEDKHPVSDDLCYHRIPVHLCRIERRERLSRHKAKVTLIEKMVSPGGLHRTYTPPGRSQRFMFRIQLSNGTEGITTFDQVVPKLQINDIVIYELKMVKKEPRIIIKDTINF